MQPIAHHIRGISLRDALPDARILGGDIRVTSCCGDWRSCRPGDLYVALDGIDEDGHHYAREAVAAGASAVLAERHLATAVPLAVVPDTREAFGHVCQALVGRPADHLKVIGVTGTNGKTTVAHLIRSVLEAAGQRSGITSTLAYCDGFDEQPASHTTPAAPQMAEWLARMQANGCSHAVLEMSSRGLAQRRAAGVQFDAAVVTNVRRDHIDYHGSVVNYRRAKARLFDQLKPEGFAVVNSDDPTCQRFLDQLSHPALTFGMRTPAELTATVVERHKSEQTFLLHAGNDSVPVRTSMIGDHHVSNCLAAAAVGLVMGADLISVARGLEAVDCVPGRLQRIECGQPFGVFVDYARTPDALAVSLNTLRQVTTGRLICVFGARSDGDPALRPLIGRVVERHADMAVITSDNPGHEEPLRIAHDILDGYDQPSRPHVLPNRLKAIHWALDQARPDDTVLIAGKGHEDFQLLGSTRCHCDDRETVRTWLYEVGAKVDYFTTATSQGLSRSYFA